MKRSVPSMMNAFVAPSNLMSRRRHAPSALNGRMANASVQLRLSAPAFVTVASRTSVVPFTYAVCPSVTPPHSKIVVTIGRPRVSVCRTFADREGKYATSPHLSQHSDVHLFRYGINAPRGSTTGSSGQEGLPTAVQFLRVTLIESPRWERGMNPASAGSNCRAAQ